MATPRNPPRKPASDDAIAEAAAAWIVRLSADTEAERRAAGRGFEAWKRADPRHAEIAAEMERFVAQTQRLRGTAPCPSTDPTPTARAAHAALDAALRPPAARPELPKPRRGRRAGLIAMLLTAALAACWLSAEAPRQWLADLRSTPGEQPSHLLADGSRLTLSGASAVNVELGTALRRVELLGGELLLEVAKDAHRPLVVDTPQGRIRALGTRFIVRHEVDATLLTMLESSTLLSPARTLEPGQQAAPTVVSAGQRVRLSAQGVERLAPVNAGLVDEAFRHRRLVVQDRPLPEVLDELARHRRGLLRYRPAALQDMRVTAVLPLDDTDRALQLLAASFPRLSLRTLTPWLLVVEARP